MDTEFACELGIYRARKLLNSKYKNHKVLMPSFNSIPTSPKRIIKRFRQKTCKTIIELCNTKEYQGFGS